MADLQSKYGKDVGETDLMSHVMYPKVYEAFKNDTERYGDVSKLPTRAYIEPMELGEEISVELEKGKTLGIKLVAVGQLNAKEGTREVYFEFNGMPRSVKINDRTAQSTKVVRAKAAEVPGGVGAPMPGVVVETKVKIGDPVELGTPMLVLSAMKMETTVAAPGPGRVDSISVKSGDDVEAGDVLITLGWRGATWRRGAHAAHGRPGAGRAVRGEEVAAAARRPSRAQPAVERKKRRLANWSSSGRSRPLEVETGADALDALRAPAGELARARGSHSAGRCREARRGEVQPRRPCMLDKPRSSAQCAWTRRRTSRSTRAATACAPFARSRSTSARRAGRTSPGAFGLY